MPEKQTQSNPISIPTPSLLSAERSPGAPGIYRESIRNHPPTKPKSPAPALTFDLSNAPKSHKICTFPAPPLSKGGTAPCRQS